MIGRDWSSWLIEEVRKSKVIYPNQKHTRNKYTKYAQNAEEFTYRAAILVTFW